MSEPCGLCGKSGDLNDEIKDGIKTIPVHEVCKLKMNIMKLEDRVGRLVDENQKLMMKVYT